MDRLSRFFKLVHNEYIKLFKKSAAIVLLIIAILIAVLTEFILCSNHSSYTEISEEISENIDQDNNTQIETDIKMYERTKPVHYEKKTEILRYMKDSLIRNGSWQGNALMRYVSYPYGKNEAFPDEDVQKIKDFIKADDWKGCYELLISSSLTNEEDKFEYRFRIEYNVPHGDKIYRENVVSDVLRIYKLAPIFGDKTGLSQSSKDKLAVCEYMLDNDIAFSVSDYGNSISMSDHANTWSIWSASSVLIYIVAVLVMIFAGDIVANEHSQGTIKFLLVNPVKRWKILASKLFTVMSVAFVLSVFMFIFGGVCAAVFIGTDGQKAAWLTVSGGSVSESSPMLYMVCHWLLQCIPMFVLVTFAFSLSTFARKSSIAITLSIVILLIGSTITSLLASLDCDWARFLLFANLDIGSIMEGESLFYRHSVGFAVLVLVEHMAVFLITAFDSFRKKSV